MANQEVGRRLITNYEGIELFVDYVREQTIAWFDSNGRNDTLFTLMVDDDPARNRG